MLAGLACFDVTGDHGDECRKQHTKQGVWNPHQSTPVSMSTLEASLNVLTAGDNLHS